MSNFSLIDALSGIAATYPGREAIRTPETTLTHAELMGMASRCARYFSDHGIAAGDRVAIALPKSDQVIIAILACWMLGATGMVIDFRTRPREKAQMRDFFSLRAIVEPRSSAGQSASGSIAVGDSLIDSIATESPELRYRPADVHPAIILRTSGTTGTPQGIVFNHGTLMRLHWAMGAAYLGSDRGLFVHGMPMFYGSGLVRTISQLLDGGSTYILPMIASPDELAEAIISTDAQAAAVVPPQMHGLLELSAGRTSPMFPNLRVFTGSGAKFPAETVLRAYRELSNSFRVTYGASFGGSISALSGPDVLRKPDTVGRPLAFNQVQIVDFEGRPVPTGQSGLIRLRSATVADAIIGETRQHSDRMVDGWAVPGDTGFIDEEGFLTLTGRASDMIIRKGVNVFPREIEDILERRGDVLEAAVIGYPDDDAGEEIAAFVVVEGNVAKEELESYVNTNIVADKRPRTIRIVDGLPRNDAGKVLKRVLADKLASGEE